MRFIILLTKTSNVSTDILKNLKNDLGVDVNLYTHDRIHHKYYDSCSSYELMLTFFFFFYLNKNYVALGFRKALLAELF